MVGITAILFAVFGYWHNANTFIAYKSGGFSHLPADLSIPHFDAAFLALSAICVSYFSVLAFCGFHFFRLSASWLWLFVAVSAAEVLSVFAVGGLWLLPNHGLSIAAASGISMGGLTPQLFLLFPLWGPIAVWFSRKSLRNADPPTHPSSGTR